MNSTLSNFDAKRQEAAILTEIIRRKNTRRIWQFYPDDGPLRRELYPKHLSFFKAGQTYRERCFIAGNRVGKTEGVGLYELVLHLTGLYPAWWEGRRFSKPIRAICAGKTSQTTRDILQSKLMGVGSYGQGLLPEDCIVRYLKKAGVPDALESVDIKHIAGGLSRLVFKSFDQGRQSFEGTEQDVVHLDEEAPDSVYQECCVRTMTTGGMVMLTFTPLLGLTPVVCRFLPDGAMPVEDTGRFVVSATWDDVPHLKEEDKKEILETTEPHLREARSKGIPHLGSGSIYPITDMNEILVDPFEIPPFWPKVFAMDVGWNNTSALWGALDRDSDILYLYSEHSVGQERPPMHAAAIRARGEWIPGVIDPAARGRSQADGEQLFVTYQDLGLDLSPAQNAVEAGIYEVWTRLSSGRLKVFSTLKRFQGEFRKYRRDEKGKVVKFDDHLMDCMRYMVMSGIDIAESEYKAKNRMYDEEAEYVEEADNICGY